MSIGTALAAYPEKPVKIIVGFSAGGGTDTTARGFASYMHEAPSMNGMPAVITNIPGASGQKGAKVVVDGDIFHANSVRALFDFEDAIDE